MIIGNGLLAKAFNNSADMFNDCLIFASGVSNSKSEDDKEFKREFNLLKEYVNTEKKFIYFSSIHILDPSEKNSLYVKHKIKIESFISNNFSNYIIYRLPIVIGKGGNKKSLFNYLFNALVNNIEITIFLNAYRYILDIDSIVYFVSKTKYSKNQTINLVPDKPFSILTILQSFEECLSISMKYTTIEKGYMFKVDNRIFKYLFKKDKELDNYIKKEYISEIIKKYYL